MLWSTHKRGDPRAIAHRMVDAGVPGRPESPVCGISTGRLFLRAWTSWGNVPEPQRCPVCAARSQEDAVARA